MDAQSAQQAVLSEFPQKLIKYKAWQLSRQRGFERHEKEDLKQELTARILKELHRFDSSRGELGAFIRCVVESAAGMLARERSRAKRGGGSRPTSLDQTSPRKKDQPSLAGQLTPIDLGRRLGLLPTPPTDAEDVRAAIAQLSSEDQAVCRELMVGNVNSAARNLGVSRRQVRAAIGRIRARFERAGLEDS